MPLANPQTAASLLQLAAAIARDRHYELECLQVILVPRHSPSETQVSTAKVAVCCVRLKFGTKWKIPVHTQIRVTHDGKAMLETINERHIDDLDGLEGNTITPGRIFGSVVDTLVRQATCRAGEIG